jgi:hypothetical protein
LKKEPGNPDAFMQNTPARGLLKQLIVLAFCWAGTNVIKLSNLPFFRLNQLSVVTFAYPESVEMVKLKKFLTVVRTQIAV